MRAGAAKCYRSKIGEVLEERGSKLQIVIWSYNRIF